jgi:CDGSH-type Zn-finger protein
MEIMEYVKFTILSAICVRLISSNKPASDGDHVKVTHAETIGQQESIKIG